MHFRFGFLAIAAVLSLSAQETAAPAIPVQEVKQSASPSTIFSSRQAPKSR
ncbi:MAG TPA: hypothetical protein VKT81_07675 [Bryobacteraceae bacterium]|nr:hypothetical protein [Bryobacteraceae bacterium]